jgi:hypothetical protein
MNQVVIFVEGEYDQRIISRLGLGGNLMIKRAPGKMGMKAFMQGFKEGGVVSAEHLLGFRDRDFDYPMPPTPSLSIPEADKGKILVAHRVTIENYLLGVDSFALLLKDLKNEAIGGLDKAEFRQLLRQSAQDIRYYQAARHALGMVREGNNLGTSWMERSGDLPQDLSEKACLENGRYILEEYATKAAEIASTQRFVEGFEHFLAKFDNDFFEREDYLIWFQAKDLQTRFGQLAQAKGFNFPFKSMYRTALNHFDFSKFPDLVQLHSHLKNLIEN